MILTRRVCYIADGLGPLAPQAIPLEWFEGAYVEIPWQLRSSNNAPKDLAGALDVLIHFRYHDNDARPFLTIQGVITVQANGDFKFVVPLGSPLLKRGFYVYEVVLQDSTERFEILVPRSRLQIKPADISAGGALVMLPVYFGSEAVPGAIDEAFVKSLSTALDETRFRDVEFDAGPGVHGWYCYPASFGGEATDFFDAETDLEAGVFLAATVDITDDDLVVRPYFVWRTETAGLGPWTMEAR
jgi:hypothetical protein